MSNRKYILQADVAEKKLRRMALEIAERNYDEQQIILIGIKDHGTVIAQKICDALKNNFRGEVVVMDLTIDKKHPADVTFSAAPDVQGKTVVLVDDVANSGKTMLYALKPLLEQYPKKIQTLALVERTHKTFPVAMDYVGVSVSTTPDEHIFVEEQNGNILGAYIVAG
ncbi:MAG: phosphoribosyltransferase [Bacteroidetes bacterium]|nr:phosphoribosyltransferase [Bacteroidota bacterium]